MRLFRCGCGLISILPFVLLLAGVLFVLNDPHVLPGPLGDFAAGGRTGLATLALGVELNSSDLSVDSVEYDATQGGSLTLTLVTSKTTAPAAQDLAPTFKAVGGHSTGPLTLFDGALTQVVIVIQRADNDQRLVAFSVSSADLQAYAAGDMAIEVFLKRVTTTL